MKFKDISCKNPEAAMKKAKVGSPQYWPESTYIQESKENMRLKSYLIQELAMKAGTDIKYTKVTPDAFYATITLSSKKGKFYDEENPPESFDIFAASDWYSKFHLAQKLRIPEERIVEELKGKAVYGIYIWNIDFVDKEGNIALSPKAKGVALQLFAAIEVYMKEFAKKYDPQGIEFSGYAREQSRRNLYHHLSKKIEKAGYRYFPIGDYYTLIKKEYLK